MLAESMGAAQITIKNSQFMYICSFENFIKYYLCTYQTMDSVS